MARHRMHHALLEYPVLGIHTNHAYLQALLEHPDYIENRISTHFCEDHHEELTAYIESGKILFPLNHALLAYVLYSLQKKSDIPSNIWLEIGFWRHTSTRNALIDGQSCEINLRNTA